MLQSQRADGDSVLTQYRSLTTLRQRELPLHRGWFCHVHADASVFSFIRELDGLDSAFLMVLNFGQAAAVTDLSSVGELPDQLLVLQSTTSARNGEMIPKSHIVTQAGEGLVIRYSAHTRFHPTHPAQCFISEKACYLKLMNILYKC